MLSFLVVEGTQEIISSQTVWEFLESGGPIMVPIALCSVVALAFAMERLIFLRRDKVAPAGVAEAVQMLHEGRSGDALTRTRELDGAAARILAAGLRREGMPVEQIERAMEDQSKKETEKLRSNIRPLQLIAGITPLLGLLGTVMGIQDSFHLVVRAGLGKPEHLASGIEEALVTTIAGLTVAIPTLLVAFYLTARTRRLMLQVDDLLAPVIEVLTPSPTHSQKEPPRAS
ncbi:MAG: MotA/TolQ/ExbB proton channel family protein [Planctomycetota bacterium]|jgi:biopolymer transport protein ExbB